MLGCKPPNAPMDSTKIGVRTDNALVYRRRYQRLVRQLIYLSHTRPEIDFVVSAVSWFMSNPTEDHMEAVNRNLRYLKMNSSKGLSYKKSDNIILKSSQMQTRQKIFHTNVLHLDTAHIFGKIL